MSTISSPPIISILMPVYNSAAHLKEAIESMLNQTFEDFELIIAYDQSQDESIDIINAFHKTDPRIIICSGTKRGLVQSLNDAIEISAGKYVARMDADDVSLTHRLETQLRFLENNTEIGICGSWFESFGDKSVVCKYETTDDAIKLRMLYECHFCHPSVMIRKGILSQYNIRYRSLFSHAEDYDFWWQLSKVTKFANIPEVLLKYRLHDHNVSKSNEESRVRNREIAVANFFNNMNVNVSHVEVTDYAKLNYQDYHNIELSAIELSDFLEKIISGNKKSKFITPKILADHLADLWYHYCYKTKQQQIFFESTLSRVKPLNIKDKLRMKLFAN